MAAVKHGICVPIATLECLHLPITVWRSDFVIMFLDEVVLVCCRIPGAK